jgi:hypothetical protein
MRSFKRNKLGKMDQITHLINEQYLLSEIQKIQEKKGSSDGAKVEGNFNA